MTIDIKQLRYAVTAADTSSFMRAARQLKVKQSTLSKKVSALEAKLGITLFEGSTRGVIPTESGRAFLEVARRIVTDTDNLLTTARAVRYGEVGRLMIAFSSSLSAGNLRMLLSDVLFKLPDVQLDAFEGSPEQMAGRLQSRIDDVAIHPTVLEESDLCRRWLWSERLMVVLPSDHHLASQDSVLWLDLRRCVFVMPQGRNGPQISEIIRQRMAMSGLKANIITQDASSESICAMVPYGKFVTVVSESATGSARTDITFRAIADPSGVAHLDFSAWWRQDNDNPALARFFKLIDERYPPTSAG